ncbi:MAG TPA: hypothetical protein VML75_10935 [Kofleriaceae bacterium]|nr:hypothetical protein [Kofleriaceae bacterium]
MRPSLHPSVIGALLVLASGCGTRSVGGGAGRPVPPSTVTVGTCGDPARDGVIGPGAAIEHADRDLNGDGTPELVVVDRGLCSGAGNCHWNIFSGTTDGCRRYLGTVAAHGIEPLRERGEDGYRDLRGWWRLSGGGRVLLQHYQYRAGGYRVIDALVCRQEGDDRLLCAEDRAAPDQGE